MRAVTGDERLDRYLTAQYARLGVLRVSACGKGGAEALLKRQGVAYEKADLVLGALLTVPVDLYEYHSPNDNARRWITQWIEGGGDDGEWVMVVWSRKPSREGIFDYLRASKIEIGFDLERLSPNFTCSECGRDVHVLDCAEPILSEVLRVMEERWCGC